ncbi:hypothetical protein [Priestia megaterium]|uniref:hypothetical protein n=1 Tax=Priestia megaterium TaxID=1404 RepID=UPI003D0912F8
MSEYYYKKVIKDSNDNKLKEKPKYENDKEEFELKNHDDKCHKCHKCHDDKCHQCCNKKQEIVELSVDETSPMSTPPTTTTSGSPVPSNTRAQVRACVDDPDAKVLLQGTVEWKPRGFTLLEEILLLLATLEIPLALLGTFRIWRSCDNGPAVQIFETSDTSPASALDLAGLVTPVGDELIELSTVTTSFHWVDKNPCCGINRYYLTLDISLEDDPTLMPDATITDIITVPTLLSSLIGPFRFDTGTVVFTALEIEEQDY